MRIIVPTIIAGAIAIGLFAGGAFSDDVMGKTLPSSSSVNQPVPMAQIEVPVSSSFGVYRPYQVPKYRAEVGLTERQIAPGFSNVVVAQGSFPWNSYFSSDERAMLLKDAFMARPEAIGSFGQAYAPELSSQEIGSFVTVDALLHGLRVTVDEATRDMERNYDVTVLGAEMAQLAQTVAVQPSNARGPALNDAVIRVLGYVQTAQALLDPTASIDPRVQSAVNDEVRKITAASGVANSSVLRGESIDYSQFVPTGYYAIDAKLANYYRAKTWLGRTGFNVRNAEGRADLAGLRAATILARAVTGIGDQDGFNQSLRNITEPAAFFSGAEGSSQWDILNNAARGYYGRIVSNGPAFLNDDQLLAGFAEYLEEQLPSVADRSGLPAFRLFDVTPQSGSTDLAWKDSHPSRGGYGLSLMAAMGSGRADAVRGIEGDKPVLASRPSESWVQTLESSLLYAIQPLALEQERTNGYPRFMRSDDWRNRELTSAMGAWADYRSVPTRMEMTSVAKVAGVSRGNSELKTDGYVEPNPEAWSRVASLAAYIRSGLSEGRVERLVNRKIEMKLQDIENVAARMMQISAFELEGKDLTEEQMSLIRSMPVRIAAYESFTDKSLQGNGYSVAAGGTQLSGGTTVANGHPLAIYVIVPRNDGEDGLMLTRGAVSSYYEVATPVDVWVKSISEPSAAIKADGRLASFVSTDRQIAQDAGKFQAVTATLPSVATAYVPTKQDKMEVKPAAQIKLEANIVSRSVGELWFTVHAPQLEGDELVVSVANVGGQTVLRSETGKVEKGDRLDVLRIGDLSSGQYFIRVADAGGTMLASSRFIVIR
ncbi:MAG: DUF3160 domain-containing protein [Candidatus Kapaibacterium sp.]